MSICTSSRTPFPHGGYISTSARVLVSFLHREEEVEAVVATTSVCGSAVLVLLARLPCLCLPSPYGGLLDGLYDSSVPGALC